MFQGDAFQGDAFQAGWPEQRGGSSIFVVAYDQPWIAPNAASSLYFQNPALDVQVETNVSFVGRFSAPRHSVLPQFRQVPALDVSAQNTALAANVSLAVVGKASPQTVALRSLGLVSVMGPAGSPMRPPYGSFVRASAVALLGYVTAQAKAQAQPTGKVGLSAIAQIRGIAHNAMTGVTALAARVINLATAQAKPGNIVPVIARVVTAARSALAQWTGTAALHGQVETTAATRALPPSGKASLFGRATSTTQSNLVYGAIVGDKSGNPHFVGRFNSPAYKILTRLRQNPDESSAQFIDNSGASILVVNFDWPGAPIKASYLYSFNTAQDTIINVEFDPHFIGRFTPTKFLSLATLRQNTAQDPPPVVTAPLTGLATTQAKSQGNPVAPLPEANPHFLGRFRATTLSVLKFYRQGGTDGSVLEIAGQVVTALKSTQSPLNRGAQVEAAPHFLGRFKEPKYSISATLRQNPAEPAATVTFSTSSSPFVVAYEWPSAPIKASYLYSFNSAQDVPPVTGPLAITGRIAALLKSAPAGISTPEANPHFLGQYTGPIFSLLGLLRQGGADAPPIVETNPHYIGRYTPMQLRLLTALRQNNSTDQTFGFASLSGRAGVAVKTRPNTSAKLVLSGRASTLFKQLRTVFHASFPLSASLTFGPVISHNATAGVMTLAARATALVNALAQPGGKLRLIGHGAFTAQANAVRSGIANLVGKASTAVRAMVPAPVGDLALTATILTLQAVIHGQPEYISPLLGLLSTGAFQVKARAKPSGFIGLFGLASAMTNAQSDLGVFFALVAQLRSQTAVGATATGAATLFGLASAMTKIRPNGIPIAVMLGRIATAVGAQLAAAPIFPLFASLATMVGALAAPTSAATLNATASLASKLRPGIAGKYALAARIALQTVVHAKVVNTIELASILIAKIKANTSYTLQATLSALSQYQVTTARPRLTGKIQLAAVTLFQAAAEGITTGNAKMFSAIAVTMAKARSSAPQGVVGLISAITAQAQSNLSRSRGLVLQAIMALQTAVRAVAPRIVIRLFSDRDYITAPNTMTAASSVYSAPSTWRVTVTVPAKPSPSMPQGRDFSPIDPGETITGTFDFARWLSSGAQIQSVTSVICAVATSSNYSDVSASSRIVGAPQIGPSPFSGLPNVCVLQQWGGMVPNVLYVMTAVVVTTDGQTLKLWAHQPCGASN